MIVPSTLPLVSIITVTYNAENELEETILSIIHQTYANIEFIIIDGNSTDNTLQIIEKYKDKIDFFISESDEGIYDAMNKGITHAKGEWLNFMNAGDSFASLKILEQLEDKLLDPNIDIICGDRYLLHNEKKTLQKPKGIIDFWTEGSPCFHQSMLIRKKTIDQKQYNTCYKLSADYEFMVRSVVEKKHFEFVDLPISNFLEGGVSKQQVIYSQIETLKILLDHTKDEEIIHNNIFFKGLINQNKSRVSQSQPKKHKIRKIQPKILHKNNVIKNAKKKILVVDPIFRGSRLFYSWLASDVYAKKDYHVDILSRSYAPTDQYSEYFKDVSHILYDGIEVSEDFWFDLLTKKNVQEMLGKLLYLEQQNSYDYIYFAGLNEQYPNLFDYMNTHIIQELKTKKMLFIEYDVRHIIKEKNYLQLNHLTKSIKTNLRSKKYAYKRKKSIFSFLKNYNNTYIGVLDERLTHNRFSKIIKKNIFKHFFYLPDPSPEIIYHDRPTRTGATKVLLVGLQNRRKGLDQLIKYLRKYKDTNEIDFTLVGRLTEETELYRDFLISNPHIVWHEGYYPEKEIQKFYSETDYVFLPYTPDFTASSGVLAYATCFKKPVISTEHGLIGYKTISYNMGYTYPYNNIVKLHKLFMKLPKRTDKKYIQLSENTQVHTEKHSIKAHQNTLLKVLTHD